MSLIQQTTQLQLEEADRVFEASEKNAKDEAAKDKARLEAHLQAAKAMQPMPAEYMQKAIGAVGQAFNPEQQALEGGISYQEQAEKQGYAFQTSVPAQTEKLIANLKQQRDIYMQMLPTLRQFPELWEQTSQKVMSLNESMLKYNEQLLQARSISQMISGAAAEMSQQSLSVFHSRSAQSIGQAVEAGAKTMQQSTVWGNQIAGAFGGKQTKKLNPMEQLQQDAAAVFDAAKKSSSNLDTVFGGLARAANAAASALGRVAGGENDTDKAMGEMQALPGARPPIVLGSVYSPSPAAADAAAATQPQTGGSGKGSGGIFGQSQEAIDRWTKGLLASTAAISSFVSTITGAKNAAAGAAGGAVAGGGVGNTAGTAMSQMGGAMAGLSQYAGPAGAVLGMVTGMITGAKNNAIINNINNFEADMRSIMQQFADNTNNLNTAILAAQVLVAQIQQTQSNSKKGGSQYQSLITQYQQQIISLQAQQVQIVNQMNEQVAVLQNPIGIQDALTSFEQLIKTYQQFAGAATNATELATATNYLTLSLQNYTQTQSQQLSQDETQAIQDAIQLNDLLQQRIDLTNQVNNQISSVLSAGVLTRQQTRAQTAGQQIEQVEYQAQIQLENLNEQISQEQYKVSLEKQIFDMSTTRIGLEGQLLQLQNAQTTLDMARISALQQLVTQLQSGNLSGGIIGQIIGSFPTVSTTAGVVSNPLTGAIVPGTVPVTAASTVSFTTNGQTFQLTSDQFNAINSFAGSGWQVGIQNYAQLDQLISAAYNQRASMGYATFRGTNLP